MSSTDCAGPVRTLFLLRHAKSSWDHPGLADRDRPLAPRGRRAAPAMARRMRDDPGLLPELVVVSPAVRTRETWRRMRDVLPSGIQVEIEPRLYGADSADLLDVLGGVDDAVGRVLLLGHNPGLHDLSRALVGEGPPGPMARLARKLPTAALVVLDVPGDGWGDLAAGSGVLRRFLRPKDLPDTERRRL